MPKTIRKTFYLPGTEYDGAGDCAGGNGAGVGLAGGDVAQLVGLGAGAGGAGAGGAACPPYPGLGDCDGAGTGEGAGHDEGAGTGELGGGAGAIGCTAGDDA